MKEIQYIDSVNFNDTLALTRTRLSNERTLLSYVRTGIAFLIAGAGIMRFIEDGVYVFVSGWSLIIVGGIVAGWGLMNYRKLQNALITIKV